MRGYDELADRVFKKANERLERKKIKTAKLRRNALITSGLCAALLVSVGIWKNSALRLRPDDSFVSSGIVSELPETTGVAENMTTVSSRSTVTTVAVTEKTSATKATSAANTTEKLSQGTTASAEIGTSALRTTVSTASQGRVSTTAVSQSTASSSGSGVSQTTVPNIGTTDWDDIPINYRYRSFDMVDSFESATKKRDYYSYGAISHENNIGELLENRTFYTEHTASDGTQAEYQTTGDIYVIRNISEYAALAVRFSDTDEYYIYLNNSYQPDTLGELITDLNLGSGCFTGEAILHERTGGFRQMYYSGIGTEYIWEKMAAVKDLENTGVYNGRAEMELELNVYLPELDRAPSIYVTSDGYIHTTLNPMGCTFYIGTDMANEIISYIVDNYQEDNSVSGAV